jgi:hypothetical protein
MVNTYWGAALGMSNWRGQTASLAGHGGMKQRQEVVMPGYGLWVETLQPVTRSWMCLASRGTVGLLLVLVHIVHTEEHFLAWDGLVHLDLGQSEY